MKIIDGKEIIYKEVFGLFTRPYLINYVKEHKELLESKLKVVVRLFTDIDRIVNVSYKNIFDLELLALENALRIKSVYYCSDEVYILCYWGILW